MNDTVIYFLLLLFLLLDLYRDLDRCSNQGIEDYGVSMTTLNEVFLKLEGKSMAEEPGKGGYSEGDDDVQAIVGTRKLREEIES